MLQGFVPRVLTLSAIGVVASVGLHLSDIDVILPRTDAVFVAFETSVTLTLLLVAFLAIGRFMRRRLLRDALLVMAFVTMAGAGLLEWMIPVVGDGSRWSAAAWQQAMLRVVAALLLASAAWLPGQGERTRDRPWPTVAASVAAPVALFVALGLVIDRVVLPAFGSTTNAATVLHPAAAMLEVSAMLALGTAAGGLVRSYREAHDPFLAWLTVAAVALALARGSNVLAPTLVRPDLHVADAWRLLAVVLLVIGGLREISASWRSYAQEVLSGERRRVARDLHDGVAQELNFILAAARRLPAADAGHGEPREIQAAAARALDETRLAISAATHRPDEPAEALLEAFAVQVANRHGGWARVHCDPGSPLSDDVLLHVVRIVREAVTNAMVHGNAHVVDVELHRGATNVLRIHDDGDGFDRNGRELPGGADGPGAGELHTHDHDSFGLTSMGQRATLLGGRLRVSSSHGEGTIVEVEW